LKHPPQPTYLFFPYTSLFRSGIVLDGQVISAPQVQEPSPGGEASISGNFSQEQASQLSDQLRFGALPLEFTVASEQQISATLGRSEEHTSELQSRFEIVCRLL